MFRSATAPPDRRPRGVRDVTLLIWPESAFPFFFEREAGRADPDRRSAAAGPGAGHRRGAARRAAGRRKERRVFNSIRVLGDDGAIVGDLRQGAPGAVRRVPAVSALPRKPRAASNSRACTADFRAGPRLRALSIPGAAAGRAADLLRGDLPRRRRPEGPRPEWLLNVTNDAWFGRSPGPYQHFVQARLRTIEEGLPLVRAANNGISAVVDPLGRVVRSLPLGVDGVIDCAAAQVDRSLRSSRATAMRSS